jgi:hypothetical protein
MRVGDVDLGDVRQIDGVTCGPTAVLVATAMLDPAYAAGLDATPTGLARELRRIHRASNRRWPRRWGTTPWGVAAALSAPDRPYRVRRFRPDRVAGVVAALDRGRPVALLIGRVVPRHWVLLIAHRGGAEFTVYNPASGRCPTVAAADLRRGTLPFAFPRPYALVLPAPGVESAD